MILIPCGLSVGKPNRTTATVTKLGPSNRMPVGNSILTRRLRDGLNHDSAGDSLLKTNGLFAESVEGPTVHLAATAPSRRAAPDNDGSVH